MKDETEKEEGEIKPAQLWAFLKDNDDIQLVGRVCVALGGHDVELNAAERACLNLIIRDSVWRKRNVDLKKKRNAEYYEKMKGLKKIQSDSETENDLKKIQSDSAPIHPSIHPSNPSTHPSTQKESNNRSDNEPMSVGSGRTAAGSGAKMLIQAGESTAGKLAAEFADVVNSKGPDGGEAFFDGRFDAVTICVALTGDSSTRLWRSYVNDKGEDAVREEAFAFWREIQSGEDADNRGAALNARLGKLKDATVVK